MTNQEKTAIEEVELTKEETNGILRANERTILQGLLEAAAFKEDEENLIPIEIVRNKAVMFRFRIHPLSEEQYHQCRDKNTKFVRSKQMGIRFPEQTNTVRYRSELIYQATADEDREQLWNNKEAWKALNVLNGIDLIDKVLKAGEKDAILDKLDEISGYDSPVEEIAKN